MFLKLAFSAWDSHHNYGIKLVSNIIYVEKSLKAKDKDSDKGNAIYQFSMEFIDERKYAIIELSIKWKNQLWSSWFT